MSPEDEAERGRLADELLPELILLGVSLGVQVAALLLISNRDALTRGWMRLQARVSAHAERERQDVAVAQFRRDVSVWEHEQAGK